jgi:hypothetical protein
MSLKRSIILFVLVGIGMFLISGCKQSTDSMLSVSRAEWRLEQLSTGSGALYLKLVGSTTGEKVEIMTFGDGLIEMKELRLSDGQKFNEDVEIAFSHAGFTTPVTFETLLKASSSNGESVSITLKCPGLY